MSIKLLHSIGKVIKFDTVLLNAIILAVVNGIGILYIKRINPNKDADRYYHQKEPHKYIVFNMAYTILMISMAVNARYVFSHCVKNAYAYAKATYIG